MCLENLPCSPALWRGWGCEMRAAINDSSSLQLGGVREEEDNHKGAAAYELCLLFPAEG